MAAQVMPALKQGDFSPIARRNRHFDLDEVHQLATLPEIVDLLTEIYQPELALWRSHVFTGHPGRGLGWHSDYFKTLLDDPLDHCTLHFAITEAPKGNCLMVVPGSHKWSQEERAERGFKLIGNTLDRGYGTPYYVRTQDGVEIRTITLNPGEFIVFNPGLLHASVDRKNDTSNTNPVLSAAKRAAKFGLTKLSRFGLVEDPSRLAIGFRYCHPRNAISEKAYSETLDKGHSAVLMAGSELPDGDPPFTDWRETIASRR